MGHIAQALELIRQFGLRKLIGVKRRHERALPIVRGYVVVRLFWALLNTGVLDELAEHGPCTIRELAGKFELDETILRYLCEYLDCARVLNQVSTDQYEFDKLGRIMMAEPRGVIDLMYGYEPILVNIEGLLRGSVKYGSDLSDGQIGLNRREKYIAIGSGELGRQLPFPVMADMIGKAGFRNILDLGCGDLQFLFSVCEFADVNCFGIDISVEAVQHAQSKLADSSCRDRVQVAQADMFELGDIAAQWPDIDCLTACDTFHEHLMEGTGKIESLLVRLGELFPKASILVAEFCRQSHEELKSRPTGFLEHHLFHALTRQKILSADEWHEVFRKSSWTVVEERVFNIVGHGYFLLSRSGSEPTRP